MEKHLKGQFYVLASFIVGMYIFFILNMFTSTTTSFQTPNIPQIAYVHEAIQDSINSGHGISLVLDSLSFLPEPIGVRCKSWATEEGSCSLNMDEWSCGVNVTVIYSGRIDLETTENLFTQTFKVNTSRTPISVFSNESANLYKITSDVGRSSGTLQDTSGKTIKGKWTGNTVSFRVNLVKNQVKTVYLYHTSSVSRGLFEDISILNDVGYDGTTLYANLNSKGDIEYLSLSDLSDLGDNSGPSMLFLPSTYPTSYGTNLLTYVEEGGLLVSPLGLCSTSGSCLIGNLEEITSTHSVEAIDDFSSLNPLDTNGDYFTDADISWISYSSGGLNTSRSLLGAFAYGEGYVIFVGNSSMLNTWSQLDDFTTLLLSWGLPPVSISTTIVNCPEQSP